MRLRPCLALTVAMLVASPVSVLAQSDGPVKFVKLPGGFDSTARLDVSRHAIRIGGLVRCTRGGRVRIDVTITQRATGALARGTWTARCTGVSRRWTIRAARALTGRFRSGSATACAAGSAANSRRATDAIQWCKVLRLVSG